MKSDSPSTPAHRRFSTRFIAAQKLIGQSGFFSPRLLTALLFCGAASLIATGTLPAFLRNEPQANVSQRTLTFAERVAYQRAIEDVYWRHRIWPKERPDPKPSLDAVMSQAQLEKKVSDYLRKSQALEDYWQRPITAEQLQAEMDRMATHTKQSEVLQELFEALGNDPFVIAECLARPLLAERLLPHPGLERLKPPRRTFDQTVGALTTPFLKYQVAHALRIRGIQPTSPAPRIPESLIRQSGPAPR